MALIAGGRQTQALSSLSRSVVAGGQYDHPFTSTVLLELGRMALLRGDNVTAARSFFEASISAVEYPDAGVLEEAFRYAALTHLVANQRGIYPPLVPAAKWAIRVRQLQASLFLSQAENLAVLGQTPQAAMTLDEARLAIGNRSMGAGRVGARGNYLRALVAFQQGKIAAGDEFFNLFLAYMRHGSHWLYQVFQVDRCFGSGQITARGPITPRAAMELYGELLRDPLPIDWSIRPMEALAALAVPHSPSWEHWFLVALERKDHETALEISDRARRHRFFSSLGYGGRLESLRWTLEAPETELDHKTLLQRQNLLAAYPAYAKLSQQARLLRQQLQAMPLVPSDNATFQRQSQGLGKLAAIGMTQEAMLREIALRREAASLVFPPLKSTKEIQTLLPRGQALLSFFAAGGDIYAFLMNKDHYGSWRIKSPALLFRKTGLLLREMGNYEQNRELTLKDLVDSAWKQSAKQVLDAILDGSQADFTARFPEMVIVPDGFLWYVPFEALQVNVQDQLRPLISRFRIRYAPTVSLAVPEGPGLNPAGQTAVVLGRLYGREEEDLPQKAFAEPLEVRPPLRGPAEQAAAAGSVLGLCGPHEPADRPGRHRQHQRTEALRLEPDPDRARQAWQHARRLVPAALWRAGSGDPPRFPHGRGKQHETLRAGDGRVGDFLEYPRADVQRRQDDPLEPLADRRPIELRHRPRIRPGTAPYHAGRRLAAGRAGHRRQPPEPRSRAPHQEGRRRRSAPRQSSFLLVRLHARRPRAETRGGRGGGRTARGQRKRGGPTAAQNPKDRRKPPKPAP